MRKNRILILLLVFLMIIPLNSCKKEGDDMNYSTLVPTNLPKSLPDMTGRYDYEVKNVDSVMDRFMIARSELPTEVTVLEKISLDDYPKSKKNEIYVSDKNGDDNNSGTQKAPLKTIQAALDKMSGKGGGVIFVEGGVYSAADPIVITSSHSGSEKSPLFIIGYGEEEVTVTGGKNIDASSFKNVDENDPVAKRLKDSVKDKVLYTNLYELGFTKDDILDVTKSGHGTILVSGDMYDLARFPNAYYEDGTDIDSKDLLYINHVYDTGSVTHPDSEAYLEWQERVNAEGSGLTKDSVVGWEIQIVDEKNPEADRGDNWMRDEVLSWVNTGEIYFSGCIYSGWAFGNYRIDEKCTHDGNLLGTLKDDGFYSLKSAEAASYGANASTNSAAGRNSYYLYNAIEALDTAGEWFIDKATGNLYLYPKSDDMTTDLITYIGKASDGAIYLDGAEFVVLDNITVNGSGSTGILAEKCENIVLQNLVIKNTRGYGAYMLECRESAIIYSDFSRCHKHMLEVVYRDKVLKPSNFFVQNCYFHNPTAMNQYGAIARGGCRTVISHNNFDDTCLFLNGFEHIAEYNEFRGGSKDVSDGGMIYTVSYGNLGFHIRYNLFHLFNASQRAIYNDGKAGGNYSYGNIINMREAKLGNHLQPWYTSSGHGNVCYENIIICRSEEEYRAAGGSYNGLTDYILESDLFYYYYGNGDERNSHAASWLVVGDERGRKEIELLTTAYDKEEMKKLYPDHIDYLDTIKMILSAYNLGDYNPTYDVRKLTDKTFTYKAENGVKIYVPTFKYYDENNAEQMMPDRIAIAENGEGITLSYDEISAVERMWRQGAMTVIANNLILGASDDFGDVIRNNTTDNLGYLDGTSYIGNNYTTKELESIMPDVYYFDYTVSEDGWAYLEEKMGDWFTEPLKALDYNRIGQTY